MGIQINGQSDSISATDGSISIQGGDLGSASASNLNITGIVTASNFVGNVNSTGISTFATLRATNIVGVSTAGITTAYISSVNDGPISGFRNAIINGNFNIWQRGTSFTNMIEATTYTADRWSCYRDSYTTGITVSQISGISQNGVNRNALRVQRNSGNTSTAGMNLTQSLESINSRDLAGQTVTLSFWARCGSNYSSSESNLLPIIYSGTGTDQSARGAVTGYSLVVSSNRTLTTSFQRFSITGTIPSNANQIFVQFFYTPTGTAGTNDFFDIMDIQLEPGTVATPFERRSYGQELSLCYRYYRRYNNTGTTYTAFGIGLTGSSTTVSRWGFNLDIPMRTTPVPAFTNCVGWNGAIGGAVSFLTNYSSTNFIDTDLTTSGLTNTIGLAFKVLMLSNGFIELTGCEL